MLDNARIGSSPTHYGTLSLVYAAAISTNTIKARGITFIENMTLNRNISVILSGGYVPGFGSRSGYTSLNGILTVSTGSVTADSIIIR